MHILCTSIMERRARALRSIEFQLHRRQSGPTSVARASTHFRTLKGEGRNFPSLAGPPPFFHYIPLEIW